MRSIRSKGRPFVAALFVSTLLIGGCSGDPSAVVDTLPRVAVSGTVTLDGSPMPRGKIQFDPATGVEGVTAAGEISDGKFSIGRSLGPVPGKYRVRISSRPVGKIKEGDMPGGSLKLEPETVSAKYNAKTTLEADVTADGSNSFDFVVKKS
jgi:hypothetical protein